jgi:hypothetical protein
MMEVEMSQVSIPGNTGHELGMNGLQDENKARSQAIANGRITIGKIGLWSAVPASIFRKKAMNKITKSLMKTLHILSACLWLGASASLVLLQFARVGLRTASCCSR